MELEFNFNKQLAEAQAEAVKAKDSYKEDRKDERTKIQATQQSELIDQRKKRYATKKTLNLLDLMYWADLG